MTESIRVAVSGQPNCGKSTMFNAITGATARVGNYPGITVDRLEGAYLMGDTRFKLVDLPGTYSLSAYSMEEVVARDVIVDERPDVAINMMDATALERSLYLVVQLIEIGVPLVLGLNMMDQVRRKGIQIDTEKLSRLLKVPIVECVARIGEGKDKLMQAVKSVAEKTKGKWAPLQISYGPDLDPAVEELTRRIESANFMADRYNARWLAVKYLEQDEQILKAGKKAGPLGLELEAYVNRVTERLEKEKGTYPEAIIADYRYAFISSLLNQGVVSRTSELSLDASDKADRILTHVIMGPVIMVAILLSLFYITFNIGAYPQGWVEAGFGLLGDLGTWLIPEGMAQSLVVSGIIDGVGAVLSFTPLILIMFSLLVFLEDLGYMARVAYMMDKVFKIFGLHGASVMPLIISGGLPGGCAVPGVMAARTLRSPRERLATIFTAPFTVCGAKTTAYVMLIAAFFPTHPTTAMFAVVMASWFFVLVVSRILRSTVIRGPSTPFVMELPPYRLPTLRNVAVHTWDRVWQYIKKAGTVILGISVLMWVLMTFPQLPADQAAHFESLRASAKTEIAQRSADKNLSAAESETALQKALSEIANDEGEAALRYSLAGRLGDALESITQYAGFPWQANIALIGAFAAKEVFVSTLSTAYSMGDVDTEESQSLSQRIAADPKWAMPGVIAIMVFMLLYAPCMVTVAMIIREAGIRWALFSVFGSMAFAFTLAIVVYQVGMRFF
jgi:ferrous iron transport protein B